jgi:hypothetical protein
MRHTDHFHPALLVLTVGLLTTAAIEALRPAVPVNPVTVSGRVESREPISSPRAQGSCIAVCKADAI